MPVIGVIGHRTLLDPAAVSAGIGAAFDRIEVLSQTRDDPLVLIASLIEGADQFVVQHALERRRVSTLVVGLPFPANDLEREFRHPESVQTFRALLARAQCVLHVGQTRNGSRQEAYRLAGRFILDRAQLLLAVWDGAAGRGDDQTAALVERARRHGIPLVWIHAHDASTPCAPGQGMPAEGSLTCEGL